MADLLATTGQNDDITRITVSVAEEFKVSSATLLFTHLSLTYPSPAFIAFSLSPSAITFTTQPHLISSDFATFFFFFKLFFFFLNIVRAK